MDDREEFERLLWLPLTSDSGFGVGFFSGAAAVGGSASATGA